MRVWLYGDDINTDMLFPGKYTYTCAKPDEIKPHLLEDLDPDFARTVQPGDIIFAGKNFGCGSSREQPVLGLKAVGIEAIVAKSYARIFYRAAINQGLLLIECPEAVEAYARAMAGTAEVPDRVPSVKLNLNESSLTVDTQTFKFPTLPPEILAIRNAGGLLEYTRAKLRSRVQSPKPNV
ncbi:MAG TPA: 3-isopropylmalate dehydratase [bacterium]|nr:3-isopropylmalate dehydratase [bacterium]